MADDRVFGELVLQVRHAYAESDARRAGERWGYQLCALPLRRDRNLLLGLNPGARNLADWRAEEDNGASTERQIRSWKFIQSSLPLINEHFGRLEDLNYFNVCPFRTPSADLLTDRDWELGIESFFLDAIDYVAPPELLLLGLSGAETLRRFGRAEYDDVSFEGTSGRRVRAYIGVIKGRKERHRFVAVPHPRNRIRTADRERIWDQAFAVLRES
jgi:hypothetical protein